MNIAGNRLLSSPHVDNIMCQGAAAVRAIAQNAVRRSNRSLQMKYTDATAPMPAMRFTARTDIAVRPNIAINGIDR